MPYQLRVVGKGLLNEHLTRLIKHAFDEIPRYVNKTTITNTCTPTRVDHEICINKMKTTSAHLCEKEHIRAKVTADAR